MNLSNAIYLSVVTLAYEKVSCIKQKQNYYICGDLIYENDVHIVFCDKFNSIKLV